MSATKKQRTSSSPDAGTDAVDGKSNNEDGKNLVAVSLDPTSPNLVWFKPATKEWFVGPQNDRFANPVVAATGIGDDQVRHIALQGAYLVIATEEVTRFFKLYGHSTAFGVEIGSTPTGGFYCGRWAPKNYGLPGLYWSFSGGGLRCTSAYDLEMKTPNYQPKEWPYAALMLAKGDPNHACILDVWPHYPTVTVAVSRRATTADGADEEALRLKRSCVLIETITLDEELYKRETLEKTPHRLHPHPHPKRPAMAFISPSSSSVLKKHFNLTVGARHVACAAAGWLWVWNKQTNAAALSEYDLGRPSTAAAFVNDDALLVVATTETLVVLQPHFSTFPPSAATYKVAGTKSMPEPTNVQLRLSHATGIRLIQSPKVVSGAGGVLITVVDGFRLKPTNAPIWTTQTVHLV